VAAGAYDNDRTRTFWIATDTCGETGLIRLFDLGDSTPLFDVRRTFIRCGYVKEAHYRRSWAGRDGTLHDAIGYAILRSDWETGTVTRPDWDDEPP
jgi:hypothetical protein